MSDARSYPARPYLAVSAAIVRDGKILVVRRARPPAHGLFTLPGGVVEVGETLAQAVVREVSEETGLTIEPVALAGFRETIVRDAQTRVERHFVILLLRRALAGGRAGAERGAQRGTLDRPRRARRAVDHTRPRRDRGGGVRPPRGGRGCRRPPVSG